MIINGLLVGYYVVFLVAVLGVGRLILWALKLKFNNSVEKVVFSYAFGSIAYSYFFHILGAVHLLYAPLVIAGYILPAVLSGYRLVAVEQRLQHLIGAKWWRWSKISQFSTVGPWVLLSFILFPLVPYMFLYPASWDVLAYHLPLPKFYLDVHNLQFVSWFAQTGFPIGIESLFGLGEALNEPRLSHLIHFSYIFAAAVFILFGTRQYLSEKARWIATGLFLFQPILYSEAALSAFVDYPFAFFTLITAMTLIKYYGDKKPHTLLATCILIGFLPLIKFSGLLVSVSFGLLIGWQVIKSWLKLRPELSFSKMSRNMWLACMTAASVPIAWFVRNYYYTRNPFYPFYNDFFKGLAYEPGGKVVLKDDILHNAFLNDMIENFWTTTDVEQDYVNLSSVLLLLAGFVACLFLLRDRRIERRILSQFTALIFIQLMITIGPLTRYVFFIVPLLCILITWVIMEGKSIAGVKKSILMRIGYIVFVLTVVISAFVQIDATFHTRQNMYLAVPKRHWMYFMDHQTARAMLYQQDNYRIQEYANLHLDPKQHRVLQLLDNRIYYLDIPNEFATTILGGYFTDPNTTTGDQAYQRIKSDGFTHAIKLDAWGAHPVMRQEVFNDFYSNYLTPVATESGVTLYEIK